MPSNKGKTAGVDSGLKNNRKLIERSNGKSIDSVRNKSRFPAALRARKNRKGRNNRVGKESEPSTIRSSNSKKGTLDKERKGNAESVRKKQGAFGAELVEGAKGVSSVENTEKQYDTPVEADLHIDAEAEVDADLLWPFDAVVFLGDLNYRVDLPRLEENTILRFIRK